VDVRLQTGMMRNVVYALIAENTANMWTKKMSKKVTNKLKNCLYDALNLLYLAKAYYPSISMRKSFTKKELDNIESWYDESIENVSDLYKKWS
jgi:hypothetical protein